MLVECLSLKSTLAFTVSFKQHNSLIIITSIVRCEAKTQSYAQEKQRGNDTQFSGPKLMIFYSDGATSYSTAFYQGVHEFHHNFSFLKTICSSGSHRV